MPDDPVPRPSKRYTAAVPDTADTVLQELRELWEELERTETKERSDPRRNTTIVRQIHLKADAYLQLLDRAKGFGEAPKPKN